MCRTSTTCEAQSRVSQRVWRPRPNPISPPCKQPYATCASLPWQGTANALSTAISSFIWSSADSQNPYVIEQARRILLPFFAFVRMRVTTSGQQTTVWGKDLEAHQRIVDLLREGEGEVAEQYVKRAMARFGKVAYDNWERRS
jgi:hypothetical protein